MRDVTIARNYADALLALARKAGDTAAWGRMIADVADAMERDAHLRQFLESPRVDATQKNEILGRAFQDRMPRLFVRYLQALVRNRRQMLIPGIAVAYRDLLDEAEGRVHARVTLAQQPTDAETAAIAAQLGKALGKTVVPHVAVNPAIIGGVVVKVGDRVMDGSVRRRLAMLRNRLVYGPGVR
jgi:F-type H+-transporting ATPase subunit delta